MVATIQNTDVKQKDAPGAVVVAVTSRAVFEGGDVGDDVSGVGVAFPLLQALQSVNRRLLEKDPAESLLFDVVLITTDSQQQQQSARIVRSTRHHGLDVGRFCFSSQDFTESLLSNQVNLFLSTDRSEALQASRGGVLSALLERQVSSTEQLRVMLCGDAVVRPAAGPAPPSQAAAQVPRRRGANTPIEGSSLSSTFGSRSFPPQSFSARLGEMRRRFGAADSPLSIVLVTASGGAESCGAALRTLRSRGLAVDEAYCLAGAPRSPIRSLLRPHFLLADDGVAGLED
ncbi:cytosolic 5'-nucleotidase 1A isoform X1 [Pseudoliparis swirei]|uniref:cytosolic 5'-nucleotidase 1A isoform X1 n=1 Tax=Pseudoliparis swirei TaxID=2059687 RepID=UPI0024BDC919|nr:cytosolic 5'-nucleotidase 1A isoform X1 [Pseudoliparis swirei]